jgi:hypothetical protein
MPKFNVPTKLHVPCLNGGHLLGGHERFAHLLLLGCRMVAVRVQQADGSVGN